jgi:hypothetical protein
VLWGRPQYPSNRPRWPAAGISAMGHVRTTALQQIHDAYEHGSDKVNIIGCII